jgi:hypothetical protein
MKELRSVFLGYHLFFTDNIIYIYEGYICKGVYLITCYKDHLLLSDRNSHKTRIYDPKRCNKNVIITRFSNSIQLMYISNK